MCQATVAVFICVVCHGFCTHQLNIHFFSYLLSFPPSSSSGHSSLLTSLPPSHHLGTNTLYPQTLLDAHYQASLILGEPFKHDRLFDFGHQETTLQIQRLVPVLLDHRLTPPPDESYSLHRKLSGAFLLCTRLRAEFNCHAIFNRIYQQYTFSN